MSTSYSIEIWEKINEEKQMSIETNRKKTLEKIIPFIKRYFIKKNVSKVYLIGSILQPFNFTENSDIDIAIEDLNEDYFRTMCELEEILQRNVHLIEMGNCSFAHNIKTRGLLLYEK